MEKMMEDKAIPINRQAAIMVWLEEAQSLTIKQLVERFGVSAMTIHRDLARLQELGSVKKVHGGVVLVPAVDDDGGKTAVLSNPNTTVCAMCNHKAPARTNMVITWDGGEQSTYCCPHCGLLALRRGGKTAVSALARDFLYGRMINVYQAHFLISSDVQLCCIPSTICFATATDAAKFQRGFGGDIMSYTDTIAHLTASHHSMSHHHA
jgi:hypothetical protein